MIFSAKRTTHCSLVLQMEETEANHTMTEILSWVFPGLSFLSCDRKNSLFCGRRWAINSQVVTCRGMLAEANQTFKVVMGTPCCKMVYFTSIDDTSTVRLISNDETIIRDETHCGCVIHRLDDGALCCGSVITVNKEQEWWENAALWYSCSDCNRVWEVEGAASHAVSFLWDNAWSIDRCWRVYSTEFVVEKLINNTV